MPEIALIILAAGNSSRMGEGQAKQLRTIDGITLLERTIDSGLNSRCSTIFVVLGWQFERLNALIQHKPVEIVHNRAWEEGMGTSISSAMLYLSESYIHPGAVIISTCDQPFQSSTVIDALISSHEADSSKRIVASSYAGTGGVPALFASEFFEELAGLNGAEGARSIIKRHKDKLGMVDFPNGHVDIDTETDWQKFSKEHDSTSQCLSS